MRESQTHRIHPLHLPPPQMPSRREDKHTHKNADTEVPVYNNGNDKHEGGPTKTINTNLRAASPRK